MSFRPRFVSLVALMLLAAMWPHRASADEGMWTLNRLPTDQLRREHGWAPDEAWLRRVQLASLRFGQGCSASFVSAQGLVATNHHCARGCIEDLSTAKRDLARDGFYAPRPQNELRCPGVELGQLVAIEEVTPRIQAATKGLTGDKYLEALRAEMSRLEKACSVAGERECVVVNLYRGGRYDLYTSKKYSDVRLVFAPEEAIAFLGGDPDNFNYPRYNLDVAFLRAYEGGAPAKVAEPLGWSAAPPRAGELVFVSGHPGTTQRLETIEQLRYQRDVALPASLRRLAELRGLLTEFGRRGPEQRRISQPLLFGVENSLKALTGRHAALADPAVWERKTAEERELRARVARDPKLRAAYGKAWDEIAKTVRELRTMQREYRLIEGATAFQSRLFTLARTLVRGAEERPKPQDRRLREFRDSALPSLENQLFSEAPLYHELEALTLGFSLSKFREELGMDHPLVTRVLGKKTPEELAQELVTKTQLANVDRRRALWTGGAAVVSASQDPMIELARVVDPEARALRKRFEERVEGPQGQNQELIARARFAVHGTRVYPDATGTLRLNWGTVRGYQEGPRTIAPLTTIEGAFQRHTGREPFALPRSWLEARERLALATPFNFVTTNDIIGGNSGSPMIDRQAQVIGLVFDGNIHSLGGAYVFEPAQNRAVGVTAVAISEALRTIYKATPLLQELNQR